MKVLWILSVWPEPTSSAAGVRTRQLIDACRDHGYDVHLSSPCGLNESYHLLIQEGFSASRYEPNDSRFDLFIRELKPDIVCFDRFMLEEQFGWRVREHAPSALRILDTIDLHSLRRTRQRKVSRGEDALFLTAEELLSEDALREVSSIYRSDLSLIISPFEVELLKERYGMSEELITLCRPSYEIANEILTFSQRRDLVSIGNYNHPPNADAVKILHEVVWKEIRERLAAKEITDIELHVYGSYQTDQLRALDDPKSGFRVKGWAPDVVTALGQYRVNLAPLQFGAGIKGKIADGWSAGTPCVATSIAAEGMHGELEFGGVIHDKWEEFSQQAASLYLDPIRWSSAQNNGLGIIRELYNKLNNQAHFVESIERLSVGIDSHRTRNIVGAMLWHHQHRSTEYFSRWIEAKNRISAGNNLS